MTPSEPNPVIVQRPLAALDEALRNLRTLQGRSLEALKVAHEAWAVERGLQLCAQLCLDVTTHLLASAGRDAKDYTNAIDQLGEIGVVPREFANRFRGIAGFRNVLVHGYLAVDKARVHHLLNERLGDFGEFASHVQAWLDRRGR
jgi:uncharacterized protein YutE (UPF0331/DUF86 family)